MQRRQLKSEEMAALIARAQAGEPGAMDAAVRANEAIICRVAGAYVKFCTSYEHADLMQWGRLGLVKAIRDYTPDRGAWSTCAFIYATNEIRRSLQYDLAIRIPVGVLDRARHNPRVRYPSITRSLDEPNLRSAVGESVMDADLLGERQVADDDTEAEALRHIEQSEAAQLAEAMVSRLTPREQQVIRLRYGIGDGQDRTLSEVAAILGVCRERVRQLQLHAEAKMRLREGVEAPE